ncbi:MAG: hypothetical protein FWE11_10435 [Defluviitaleaceae bacterium]|nr:hypothetical protein [Defluviitaleaceae bacterium]
MTARERLIKTLKFQPVDRVPIVEWNIRTATMREWVKQGFPEGCNQRTFFNFDPLYFSIPVSLGMNPAFEEKTIEETENYRIWQDRDGSVRKDFSEIENPGFVTRSWLSFPVESRDDFLKMKERYASADPSRYPGNWDNIARVLKNIEIPVHVTIPFLFWVARDWMGFDNLCTNFYDEPELLHEIFQFITDFTIETLARVLKTTKIDIAELKEDMAYKGAPMISPAMFREFMFPHYVRIVKFLKENGVDIVFVDCDGYPGGLIDEWIEAGVDAMSPCEVAAGVDILETRKKYPTFGLMGGVDKRELAKTKRHIYDEVMNKIPQAIAAGGFVPHVDHAVPFDVPLENYMYYNSLLSRLIRGETVEWDGE